MKKFAVTFVSLEDPSELFAEIWEGNDKEHIERLVSEDISKSGEEPGCIFLIKEIEEELSKDLKRFIVAYIYLNWDDNNMSYDKVKSYTEIWDAESNENLAEKFEEKVNSGGIDNLDICHVLSTELMHRE